MGGAAVHILGWDGDRQVWLARRDDEPSFVWVQDFADAYQAAHVSRGVDLIVPAEIYREWAVRRQAPKQPPPGVWLVVTDIDRLTGLLAARMSTIVPDGFHVRASDGMLRYSSDPGRLPGQTGDYQAGSMGTDVRVDSDGAAGVADPGGSPICSSRPC